MKTYLPLQIDADFVWRIYELDNDQGSRCIESEYFNFRAERYKMRLYCEWRLSIDVGINLRIYPGESDADLQWPFQRRVTVTITNQQCPGVRRAVTNPYRIEKPGNDNCTFESSDQFTFVYKDLLHAGLLLGNCLIVNCAIDNK